MEIIKIAEESPKEAKVIRFTGDGEFVPASMKPFKEKPKPIIHATQINEEFRVEYCHSSLVGKPGDWLVQYHTGKLSIMGNGMLTRFYEEVA